MDEPPDRSVVVIAARGSRPDNVRPSHCPRTSALRVAQESREPNEYARERPRGDSPGVCRAGEPDERRELNALEVQGALGTAPIVYSSCDWGRPNMTVKTGELSKIRRGSCLTVPSACEDRLLCQWGIGQSEKWARVYALSPTSTQNKTRRRPYLSKHERRCRIKGQGKSEPRGRSRDAQRENTRAPVTRVKHFLSATLSWTRWLGATNACF
jgi:hypothetical protein